MRAWSIAVVVPAVVTVALGLAAAADIEKVPLYTSDDLDRMFGPPPASPSDPVDKSRPEDWRWVEQFLDREYARVDADRQYDLNRREVAIAESDSEEPERIYGGSFLWGWGGGYPANGGWNVAGAGYGRPDGRSVCDAAVGRYARAGGVARLDGFRSTSARAIRRATGHSNVNRSRHQ
jgi:hypothetical protein